MRHLLLVLLLVTACPAPTGTAVKVTSPTATTVYVAFGADSAITVADWSFCVSPSGLTCNFPLTGSRVLPTGGKYLNVSLAFGGAVGCGNTKAELNVNNPNWYDVFDVSLVDGYSNKIKIIYMPPKSDAGVVLGPPAGATGNEKILGVFPVGCDVCVARCRPPCGIKADCKPGTDGCKSGTQYKPDVPCQYQGAVKGGGGSVEVIAD